VLALRFAQESRDLENGIALEMLHPAHDLRPALARMDAGLEAIRADMVHLGPEAAGPGNLALGRGYLAMRFLHPALKALEAAWDGGYRTPDTALALVRVHLEFQMRIRDLEELGFPDPGGPDDGSHLEAARRFQGLAAASTWEPPALAQARILAFEGRPREALDLARGARKGRPWFHQALVEESFVLANLGDARQRAGDDPGALARFQEAESAALEARNLARSDLTCILASVRWRLLRARARGLPPREALALLGEAESLADEALAIRPGSPRAIAARIRILLERARTLHRLGMDPGPALERVRDFLALAGPREPYGWLIPRGRALLEGAERELRYRRGS
jgi:tetratricopeptide (TPR) repeat protein